MLEYAKLTRASAPVPMTLANQEGANPFTFIFIFIHLKKITFEKI
ncbi:hypothetical protein TERMP_01362 [Thermococcus barophilus MP]|uniref:Uncharacterized protein n=1 Tax=Thermococcus barophilus (strain DSM 11836 / MP) TaxID=391623 RepID=F0LHT7_THEBM|nr:hypothetical protein TERMP_01362 [Thermococcus barophilus MP]